MFCLVTTVDCFWTQSYRNLGVSHACHQHSKYLRFADFACVGAFFNKAFVTANGLIGHEPLDRIIEIVQLQLSRCANVRCGIQSVLSATIQTMHAAYLPSAPSCNSA